MKFGHAIDENIKVEIKMMTEEDRHQLRAAAENLLSGSLQSQRSLYTQRSISSINREYIITENLIAGTRPNGRMSNVRRFFCLLITFDLLFTCLMWLICTTVSFIKLFIIYYTENEEKKYYNR